MTQIAFRIEDAHAALDDFLAGPDSASTERWIGDGRDGQFGEPIAYIVPAERMHEMRRADAAWQDWQEITEGTEEDPGQYKPWRHGPRAGTDRLLPIEPIEDAMARAMFGRNHAELDEDERNKVMAHAINILLRVQLDQDGQGAVPVLALGHDYADPGHGLRWQLAFVTAVPGLYVRVSGNGFFGEEWAILTGSGYVLRSGWYSREDACRCCEALARVLPNTDWMRLTPDAFTDRAKEAVAATIKRYGPWADRDSAEPDPEPVTDAVPAAASTS